MSAAAEVLHLDVLLCEDAIRHNLPFCHIPADYEKFFNTVQLTSIDAIHQCRGVPDAARRLYQGAFQGGRVCVSTGAGNPAHATCRPADVQYTAALRSRNRRIGS